MHGGALAQKASKQKELSDHKLVKASNKRHGGGYSACALDNNNFSPQSIKIKLKIQFFNQRSPKLGQYDNQKIWDTTCHTSFLDM